MKAFFSIILILFVSNIFGQKKVDFTYEYKKTKYKGTLTAEAITNSKKPYHFNISLKFNCTPSKDIRLILKNSDVQILRGANKYVSCTTPRKGNQLMLIAGKNALIKFQPQANAEKWEKEFNIKLTLYPSTDVKKGKIKGSPPPVIINIVVPFKVKISKPGFKKIEDKKEKNPTLKLYTDEISKLEANIENSNEITFNEISNNIHRLKNRLDQETKISESDKSSLSRRIESLQAIINQKNARIEENSETIITDEENDVVENKGNTGEIKRTGKRTGKRTTKNEDTEEDYYDDTTSGEDEEKSDSLYIILIIVGVSLLIGVAVFFILLKNKKDKKSDNENTRDEDEKNINHEEPDLSLVDIDIEEVGSVSNDSDDDIEIDIDFK